MNIGIAGAGIMGLLTAYLTLQKGWKITIFDPDDSGNCSSAAAGLLTPLGELEKCDLSICQMGLDGLRIHWPEILRRLHEKIFFHASGSLIVSHRNDAADMHRFAQTIIAKSQRDVAIQSINHDELTLLEPELSHFNNGYYLRDEGQIDSQKVLSVLKKYLIDHGVIWKSHAATHQHATQFNWILDCRGLAAKDSMPSLRGVRGELNWLHAPFVRLTRPIRLAHPRYAIYIAPRPDHIYLVGASEIESEDYSPVSVQTMLELLSAAYCVHPGFAEARIVNTITHCRPAFINHGPRIMRRGNVIAVNGLYRHGFLIAPALAHEVVRFIEGGRAGLSYADIWENAA